MKTEEPAAISSALKDSELAKLFRSIDWSATPLGDVSVWSEELKAAAGIFLNSWSEKTKPDLYNTNLQDQLRGLLNELEASKKIAEQNETLFRSIVEKTPNSLVTLIDRNYRYLLLQGDILDTFNIPHKDYSGFHITDIFPKINFESALPYYERAFNGEQIKVERERDGRHFIDHFVPMKNNKGEVENVLTISLEITEIKKAQQSLEENEIRLRLAMEGTGLATWDLDLKTGEIFYTPRLAEIFGHAPTTKLTHPEIRSQVHPADKTPIVEHAFDEALKTGIYRYEARIIKPDQTIGWIKTQGKVKYDENNVPLRMLGTVMDITEMRAQSQMLEMKVQERTAELQRQKEFVDAVFDSSVDVIAVFDKELRYISLNKKALEVYNVPELDIIGKHILDVFPLTKYSGMYNDLKKALKGKMVHNPKYKSVSLNRHFENFYIPLKHENEEVYGVLLIGHENTAILEAAEKLKATNQMLEEKNVALERSNKELESFSYVASHDLQEPLRKIQTFSDLLKNNRDNEERATLYLDKIKSSAHRMSDLIKSVLNYSRLSRMETSREEVDLNTILEEVRSDFELLIHDRNASIISDELPVVKGIPLHLNQLFANLIGNSIKFSAQDPVIKISSRLVIGEEIKDTRLNPSLLYVELKFSDNGIGFEQQFAEKIFTIFQRLHDKLTYVGTGIGLALCKKIVENHGGIIKAESEEGKGAIFIVYLPALQVS